MNKLIHWGCAAAWSAASLIPAMANTETTTEKYPPIEVRDTPLEYRQFDRVEITGSSIIAKEAKDALPLQVIGRREIERSGTSNLSELLHQLPNMINFRESGTMTGTYHGGPETAAIHGNQSGTLVLLNGRRLPFYGSQTIAGERAVVDLNFIPLAAVERIELLTDGASSRYGSDAVAGVVNIITKSSINGASLSAEYISPKNNDASGQAFNFSWGKGRVERDGYSIQIHYAAEKQKALFAGDRQASREGTQAFMVNGKQYWNFTDGQHFSFYNAPASNFVDANGQINNTYLMSHGQCPPGSYTMELYARTICQFNTQPVYTLYPATEKQQIYLKGEKYLSNQWIGFSEIMYGNLSQFSVVDNYNGYDNLLPDGNTALMSAVPLDLTRQRYENNQYHMVFGVRGKLDDWDVTSNISNGQHRVDRSYLSGLLNKSRNLNELMLTPYEIQQDPAQYSAETKNKFVPYDRASYPLIFDTGIAQLQGFESLASKTIFETDNGPVALGLGLSVRNEKVNYKSFTQKEKRPDFSGQRNNLAFFAELQAPVTANLEITVSLRQDKYSDFGHISTGKVGWKLTASEQLFFRGSVGTGFRAPTIGQLSKTSGYLDDIYIPAEGRYVKIYSAGNPDLKPEKSQQATLGFRLEPNKQWTLGMDYWRVDITDTFGRISANEVLQNINLREKYLIANDIETYIYSPNLNLGKSRTAGIDYDVEWRQPTEWGLLRWGIKGTHFLVSEKQFSNGEAFESDIERYNSASNSVTPRNQWTVHGILDKGEWSVRVSANYRSGNTETATLSDPEGNLVRYDHKVPGFWTLDLASHWNVQKNLTLRFALNNVLDKEPPQRLLTTGLLQGVDTRYANYYGRTLRLKAEYKF